MRLKLSNALHPSAREKELRFLHPLLNNQRLKSHIPTANEFLTELIHTKEGYHLFMYPFEGRLVHEVMATVMAYRISKLQSITFSIAMNDYGFELFSDQPIPVNAENITQLLSINELMNDVVASINASEMASRKFRDIAVISGMVVQSRPGNQATNKSLQSSSGLIFRVLEDHEPNNLLLKQAYTEVFNQQLEELRLRNAFLRIEKSTIVFKKATTFTPLSFPIKVDSLRQSLSNEKLVDRIRRLQLRNSTPK